MINNIEELIPEEMAKKIYEFGLNVDSTMANLAINEALSSTVLLGGKRLRPLLTLICGRFLNVEVKDLIEYAKCIEMVHAASLAHDDVIDGATKRRDSDSINMVFGNKKAILAGDYLLAHVIQTLAKAGNLGLVQEMSLVIGDLSKGEWIQWEAAEGHQYTEEIILEVALKKTASVMGWCCVAPTYMNPQGELVRDEMRAFGTNLGVAFQMIDDTLDFSGDSQKDLGLDVANGVVNTVMFEWLKLRPDLMKRFKNGENFAALYDGRLIENAIDTVKARAYALLDKCLETLAVIEKKLGSTNSTAKAALIEMINLIGQRNF